MHHQKSDFTELTSSENDVKYNLLYLPMQSYDEDQDYDLKLGSTNCIFRDVNRMSSALPHEDELIIYCTKEPSREVTVIFHPLWSTIYASDNIELLSNLEAQDARDLCEGFIEINDLIKMNDINKDHVYESKEKIDPSNYSFQKDPFGNTNFRQFIISILSDLNIISENLNADSASRNETMPHNIKDRLLIAGSSSIKNIYPLRDHIINLKGKAVSSQENIEALIRLLRMIKAKSSIVIQSQFIDQVLFMFGFDMFEDYDFISVANLSFDSIFASKAKQISMDELDEIISTKDVNS